MSQNGSIDAIEKGNAVNITSTADTTVYAITTGRTFKARYILITNLEAADTTYSIYDGPSASGNIKAKIVVGAGATQEFKGIVGMEFSTDVVIKASAFAVGSTAFVGGEER